MKTMLISDLLVARNMLLQMAGICALVGVVMCYVMETTIGGICAITAMAPFMYLFSISSLDEQDGWERFRLTLPLNRRQVIFGRYASVFVVNIGFALFAIVLGLAIAAVSGLLANWQPDSQFSWLSFDSAPPAALLSAVVMVSFVILIGSAVALPLVARFGMTKATRFAPLVVVLILAFGLGFIGSSETSFDFINTIEFWMETGNTANLALLLAGLFVFCLVLYTISAFIAAKLYEKREL